MDAVIRYDLDAWARARFGVLNEDGGRGWESGVRIFAACPSCGEPGKAWVNVRTGWVRCFRASCALEGGLPAVEVTRQLEGFVTRTEAAAFLRREFPAVGPPLLPALPLLAYDDWCELPKTVVEAAWVTFATTRGVLGGEAAAFLRQQWGLEPEHALRWSLRMCTSGHYAWRIIIPVTMGGKLVAFQARSYRNGEPKYLTSKWGKRGEPGAECGRPAEALLFNLDAVTEGSDVIIVEGAGDAMRFAAGSGCREVEVGHERGGSALGSGEFGRDAVHGMRAGWVPGAAESRVSVGAVPVALLGTALTGEKAALLAAKKPGRVIVAVDADVPQGWAEVFAERLTAWGLETAVGRWDGGKDAGSGARLVITDAEGGLVARAAGRLGRCGLQ